MSVMLADRPEIVGAIDSEIAQLEARGHYHGMGDLLCALHGVVDDAMATWNKKPGERDVLERLRQIAGLSSRALALYGATYAPPVMTLVEEKSDDEPK